jgi:hypothetical protein
MQMRRNRRAISHSLVRWVLTFLMMAQTASAAVRADNAALPSWNKGAVRSAIVGFVALVTDEDSPSYVPPEERIAVFDNDGILWAEQPMYFQLIFAQERIKALATQNPSGKPSSRFHPC